MNITDNEKYIGNTAVGIVGGASAYYLTPRVLGSQYAKLCRKYGYRFTICEQNKIWKAAEKVFAESPLKDKVQIVDYNTKNWEPIADNIVDSRRKFLKNTKNPFVKLMSKTWPSDEELKERMYVYAKGKNACYMPATSQILVNKEKKANAIFHEIGHALNAKGIGYRHMLAKTRGKAAKAVPFVFGISMLTPKDREDSPTKNPIYKRLLSFKKYSGLIAAACLIPMVAEEGVASLNGAKMAKNVLSPDLYKKMNKSNLKAFGAYSLLMLLTGVGTTLANYIKDKITGPLPKKK